MAPDPSPAMVQSPAMVPARVPDPEPVRAKADWALVPARAVVVPGPAPAPAVAAGTDPIKQDNPCSSCQRLSLVPVGKWVLQ
jgi:hypothetical protein